jgi:NADH:ubiquinone oxidoreductase subunit F (NADH-binding)
VKADLAPAPNQDRLHVDSFYHLAPHSVAEGVCQGMACFVARHLDAARWQQACGQTPRLYCLGKCYAAPASSATEDRPRVEARVSEPIVLSRLLDGGARTSRQYTQRGGYQALEAALGQSPEEVIQAVTDSGLRGRGGAGFPTGRKWSSVFQQPAAEKFVVANADEGDPGAYIDRFLLEDDPHCLIEAMTIAAFAVGARKGWIYLRNEYPEAQAILRTALDEARREGFLGERILHRDFSFDVEMAVGKGSYVCGEETALLNAIEGKRPEVRPRPPYPTACGLFGKPTIVNNVETLANIPWILRHGAGRYRAHGFSKSQGTKVVSLNSLFRRPGLYEVEFGVSLRSIVEDLGGGLQTGVLKGVIVGGPLAGIVPPGLLGTPLGFEELHAIGASVGHGGMVAFDERTSIAELIHHVFAFGAYESCGKCTPCRLGSRRVEQIFQRLLQGGLGSAREEAEWAGIVSALSRTSLCGLGTGLAEFAASASRHYGEELERCFA